MELGKIQTLQIVKRVNFGVYLAASAQDTKTVLLPLKQVPEGKEIGDEVEIFLYKDSSDRLIASTHMPLLTVGEAAKLKVKEVGKIGAFLDWGMEKDLLLPFREQTRPVQTGEEVLVAMYVDKSSRLCAKMNVYEYLSTDSPYVREAEVTGTVYETSRDYGLFVAVDDRYSALIPRQECFGDIKIGDTVRAWVTSVREDGKLNLSVRRKAYLQMDEDAAHVMEVIEAYGGELPFTDKASAEKIAEEMQMSKNAFKRAVGRLLKNGRVQITEKTIQKLEGTEQ